MSILPAFLRGNLALAALVLATVAGSAFLVGKVIWPAYQKPSNRTYASRFGFAEVQRARGVPFAVQTAPAQMRRIVTRQLGEGRVTAQPVRVPIVQRSRIASVAVQEGARVTKGQVLATLDDTLQRLTVESARLFVESAQAELERVKLGSTYNLAQERPEREGINLEASRKQIAILRERHEALQKLFTQGAVARAQVADSELRIAEADRDFQSATLGVEVSQRGQPQSVAIAENNLKRQQNNLEQALVALADCQVTAPADGIIENVLVQPGEYNQLPGSVGFVIASGLWFEAHVDQTAIHKVTAGSKAQVQLEALGGAPLEGTITRVVPIVTYSTGGPEGNRPVRALGTGTPEWPTTFSVIITLAESDHARIAPGLTGFVRIESAREALAVPLSAVTSVSAGRGLVQAISDGQRIVREVTTGDESDGWVEIQSGLHDGEIVATAGYEDLQPGDRFTAVSPAR
jgi:multidrug efflux pump subunit AcrA (membrane-fusion protein)